MPKMLSMTACNFGEIPRTGGRTNQRQSFQFIRSIKSKDLTGYIITAHVVFVRDEIAENRYFQPSEVYWLRGCL